MTRSAPLSRRYDCFKYSIALGASLIASCNGVAAPATRRATPATLDSILYTARGGEQIVLAPGQYGDVTLPARDYTSQVSVDASQAQFTSLTLRRVGRLAITGGSVNGARDATHAVLVDDSHDVAIRNMRVSGSRVGIGVSRSHDIALERNQLDGLRSDGINIASAQRVRITDNVCKNFSPIPASYDGAGKLIKDGDHPDCIQGWSRAALPPTSDVTITGNSGTGFMQGIFFARPHEGGFDRIVIRDNTFDLSIFNGIILSEARDSEVTGNVVRTIRGSVMPSVPHHPITAWIRVNRPTQPGLREQDGHPALQRWHGQMPGAGVEDLGQPGHVARLPKRVPGLG